MRNFKHYQTSQLVSSQIVNIETFWSNFGCYQICFNFWLSDGSHLCFISGAKTDQQIEIWSHRHLPPIRMEIFSRPERLRLVKDDIPEECAELGILTTTATL